MVKKKHFQGLLFYLHVGQSSSGSKFSTPTQLFWKSFKVTRAPQKETRAEAGAGERLCVTCAGERRKVPACTFLVLMRLSYKSASVSKEDNGKGKKLIRLAFH